MIFRRVMRHVTAVAVTLAAVVFCSPIRAQDLEPRTYSNSPTGLNFLIIDYAKFSAVHIMLPSPKRQALPSGALKNSWRFRGSPCGLLRLPKRIGLRSHIRLAGVMVKMSWITLPDVSTHLRPGSKPVRELNLR